MNFQDLIKVKSDKMISMDKKYQTRDGREVRVLAVDISGSNPVCVAIKSRTTGVEHVLLCTENGEFINPYNQKVRDLIEVKDSSSGE